MRRGCSSNGNDVGHKTEVGSRVLGRFELRTGSGILMRDGGRGETCQGREKRHEIVPTG